MKLTKTIARAVVAIGLGVGALTLSTGVANADNEQYLSALANSNYGFTGPAQTYLDWGHRVCADRANGIPRATIVGNLYRNNNISVDSANFVYDTALADLC